MSTYRDLFKMARDKLKQMEITDADVDAWYLLAHVYGLKRTDFLLHGDEPAPKENREFFYQLVLRRAQHEPLQQLTGTQEFMGLEFEVTKDVLIPRQDTEILVEEVRKICEGRTVLDLCTGSGCIVVSLAKLGKVKSAVGADISREALAVAERNAKRNKVRVEFVESDLFANIHENYDVIVSNPPYIPTKVITELMPEVRDHEPHIALDGSEDGLEFYRRIAADAKHHLKENGYLFFEIGYNQGNDLRQILAREGFVDIKIKKDFAGLDRVVSARLCKIGSNKGNNGGI